LLWEIGGRVGRIGVGHGRRGPGDFGFIDLTSITFIFALPEFEEDDENKDSHDQ